MCHIKKLKRQLHKFQNKLTTSGKVPAAPKDLNNLKEIHLCYANVLAVIRESKCSFNNAYRMAETACSTIRDFIIIAELRMVNEVTYTSTIKKMADPKLSVKPIEQECPKQLQGLLPIIKCLHVAKKLFPLTVHDSFYSQTALMSIQQKWLKPPNVKKSMTNSVIILTSCTFLNKVFYK